jgi:hypothetical protein
MKILYRNTFPPQTPQGLDAKHGGEVFPVNERCMVWEAQLLEKARVREEVEKRSFHKSPGDPDWDSESS